MKDLTIYVSEIFNFIKEFKYSIDKINISSNIFQSVIFKKSPYKITLYIEYSNAFLEISDGLNDYNIRIIHLIMNNFKPINMFSDIIDLEERIEKQLKNYAAILPDVIKLIEKGGDSWKEAYNNFYADLRFIQGTMKDKFTFSHPIYLKFINGDESWKSDLHEFY